MKTRGILIAAASVIVVIAAIVIFMQTGTDSGSDSGNQAPIGGQPSTGEDTSGGTQPAGQPSVTEFVIEADDKGFYMDGADIDSISTNLGESIKITFNVRTTNVYYGGLSFGGCGKSMGQATPGGSVTTEFTVQDTCTITSYWPSRSVVKDHLQVLVG